MLTTKRRLPTDDDTRYHNKMYISYQNIANSSMCKLKFLNYCVSSWCVFIHLKSVKRLADNKSLRNPLAKRATQI